MWLTLLEVDILIKRSVFYKDLCEYGGGGKGEKKTLKGQTCLDEFLQVVDKWKVQHEVFSFYLKTILNIKLSMSHFLNHQAETNSQCT